MSTDSPLFKELLNSTIERLVQEAFGPRTGLVFAEPLVGGVFNTTYRIELDDRPAPVVLRVAPESRHRLFSFERTLMKREWRINKLLRSEGIRVPEALHYGPATETLARDHSFWEFVPGQTLEKADPSDVRLATLHLQIGSEVKKLHGMKSSWFGWSGQTESRHATWPDFLLSIVTEVAERNEEQPIFPSDSIRQIMHILRLAKAETHAGTLASFLHNDLHPGNLMVDEDFNLTALIDADRCIYGPADFEIGTSELAQDIYANDQVQTSKASSLAAKTYEIVLNMFDADVCKTQLRRDDTSDFLVSCVLKDLKSFKGQ